MFHKQLKGRLVGIGHILPKNCLLRDVMKDRSDGKIRQET